MLVLLCMVMNNEYARNWTVREDGYSSLWVELIERSLAKVQFVVRWDQSPYNLAA